MNDFSAVLKCPVCNKEFFVWDVENFGWKFNGEYFCGYGCMRKVEKPYLEYINKFFEEPKKRMLPKEYNEVYNDLMFIRSLVKKRSNLKRIAYKQGESAESYQLIKQLMKDYTKKIKIFKSKYSYAVSKLDNEKYELLSKYVLSYWNGDMLTERFGKTYDEICDDFIAIMKKLKLFARMESPKNRWIRA